jgi:hypothetical protein
MSLLFPFFLAAGLLAPGWLLGRALRCPGGWIGAFIGSAVIFTNLLIALDVLKLGFTNLNLSLALAIICCGLVSWAKFRSAHGPPDSIVPREKFPWQQHHWFVLPALIGLIAIVIKTTLNPLSGYDTYFRWDFLAQQMWHQGNLQFYPPVTPQDYQSYGWCDGIAPLVSGLYFWAYLSLGRTVAWATTPVVIAQAALLFTTVYQLAARKQGSAAGCAAVAVLATSSLLLWGVAIAQETGLTALSVVAMFLFLEKSRSETERNWIVWAGIAAGFGALAREYGLLFVFFGSLDLAQRRLPLRRWAEFVLAAIVVAAPWYVRNWTRTGNPLWPHDIGGLFPVNHVHADYMKMVHEYMGIGTPAAGLLAIASSAAMGTALPFALAIASFARRGVMRSWVEAITILGIVLLWVWSIGQTSGGYVYSLRVVTPAIALCAVAAGRWLAHSACLTRGPVMALLLAIAAVDAAGRSFFMPLGSSDAWWRIPSSQWFNLRDASAIWNESPIWNALVAAAGQERIVVTEPFIQTALIKRGAHTVPLFSPEVEFLCQADGNFETDLTQLSALHVRFILLPNDLGVASIQRRGYPFFRSLESLPPSAITPVTTLYDIQHLLSERAARSKRSTSTARP